MIAAKDQDFQTYTVQNLKAYAKKFGIDQKDLMKQIFLLNVYWNKKGEVGKVGPESFNNIEKGCD